MNNKWIRAAIPALLLHVSIGTVYCWSTFKGDIATYIGKSSSQIEWAFSIAIFFLGTSAALLGKLVEKNIKISSLFAAILFSSGMLLTGLSIHFKSLIGIYLSYGVIMGTGLGIGYLTPVKNLMLWFSKNKGLATGLAVAGFGLAKMLASPIMELLLKTIGIWQMFLVLGGIYFIMMIMGHLLIQRPQSYLDNLKKEKDEMLNDPNKINKSIVKETIKNPVFIAIWLMFYINITCGLALISQEKDILKELFQEGAVAITIIVSLSALFNAVGRLGFSTLSDKFKNREMSYLIVFGMSIFIGLIVLLSNAIDNKIIFIVIPLIFIINAGYGGGFSTLPVLLHEHFGMKSISTVHGLALSAWALAGLSGNQLSSFIVNNLSYSYKYVVLTTLFLYAIAFLICFKLFKYSSKKDLNTNIIHEN